jgi:hypothetical protein
MSKEKPNLCKACLAMIHPMKFGIAAIQTTPLKFWHSS